jgi:hypothetical protein
MPGTVEITYKGVGFTTVANGAGVVALEGVWDTPDLRTADVDRARAHGQWAGVDLLGGRAITATVQLAVPHPNEASWSVLQTALRPTGDESPLAITLSGFAGGNQVVANARVRRVNIPVDIDRYQFGYPQATVEWWCTDPRFYASTDTTESVSVSSPTGLGLTFDATFDLEFGGPIPSGVINTTNDGNFAAPWVVEFEGPVLNPRIESVTEGKTLEFDGTVNAGQTLRVDSLARTATLDGASRYSWLQPGSQWPELVPGANQFRLIAAAGEGLATLTYRSAWI